jgi:hypothetical protein
MPPIRARVKNEALYGCAVNAALAIGAVVLCCLLFVGIQLGVQFRSGSVRGSSGVDVGPVRPPSATAPLLFAEAPLVNKVARLMETVGLPLSLPRQPSYKDIAEAVGEAIPAIASIRDAANAAAVAQAQASRRVQGALMRGPQLRSVVVGMAMNIDVPNLYRFVRSCRDHAPSADIVLWVNDDTGDRGDILKLFGVQARRGGAQWGGYCSSSSRRGLR